MQQHQHILIVGAGLSGLILAHGLRKAEISFAIYESEDKGCQRSRDWTIGVHWGLPLLEQLLPSHLASRLPVTTADPTLDIESYPNNQLRAFNAYTGNIIKETPVEGRLVRVSRKKLRALLSEDIDINYSHVAEDVVYDDNDRVTIKFANGASATGSTVVGTDGVHSMIRSKLFDCERSKTTPLGIDVVPVEFDLQDEDTARALYHLHPNFCIIVGDNVSLFYSMLEVPKANSQGKWRICLFVTLDEGMLQKHTEEEARTAITSLAQTLAEPFRSVLLAIPLEHSLKFAPFGYWIPSKWDSHGGRITLVGDAAHSLPPHRGQGLNSGIQDAWNFVAAAQKIQKGGEKKAVIQTYGDEVVERGANEVRRSVEAARRCTLAELTQSPWYKYGAKAMHGTQMEATSSL